MKYHYTSITTVKKPVASPNAVKDVKKKKKKRNLCIWQTCMYRCSDTVPGLEELVDILIFGI